MAEYIEREAAIKLFNFAVLDCLGMEPTIRAGDIIKALESIPAADVREVVYCKDCVYSQAWYADKRICRLWNEEDGNSVFNDGYCNYGAKPMQTRLTAART